MAVDVRTSFKEIIERGNNPLTTDVVLDRKKGDITGEHKPGYTPVSVLTSAGRLVGVKAAHSSWGGFKPGAESDV